MTDELIRDAFEEILTETPSPPPFPRGHASAGRTQWQTSALALGAGAAAVILVFGWAYLVAPDNPSDPGTSPPPTRAETNTTMATVTTLSPGVAVPDVIDLDGAAAIAAIEAAGFTAVWDEAVGQPDEPVRGQLPLPGSVEEPGSVVVISPRPGCAFYETQRQSEEDVVVLFPCISTVDAIDFEQVWRTRQPGEDELTATFRSLLAGPTDFEGELSFSSFFSIETAAALNSVTLIDGALVADFNDAILVNNASTSTGGVLFNAELRANAFQFPEVDTVEFRINGSCEAWSAYFESDGCWVVTRAEWEAQQTG